MHEQYIGITHTVDLELIWTKLSTLGDGPLFDDEFPENSRF